MSNSTKQQILQPLSLIKFQSAIEISDDMKSYHQQNHGEQQTQNHPKIQDILNSIIPPRDWNDSLDKLYIQYVSHQPASREDVIQLRERLQKVLEDRQARSLGVCPIREQLYSQAFDQIIRQVAVDCPERGLLLMRVRDQHKMTLSAYQTIYQASVSFGLKKQIESQDGVQELQQQIKDLERKQCQLQNKHDLLVCQKDLLQREIRQKNINQVNRREDQLKFLQMQTENLTKFLDSVRNQLS